MHAHCTTYIRLMCRVLIFFSLDPFALWLRFAQTFIALRTFSRLTVVFQLSFKKTNLTRHFVSLITAIEMNLW